MLILQPRWELESSVKVQLVGSFCFSWWVSYTLKKKDCIIESVNYRVTNQDHKIGIKIPKDIKEALKLYQDNGNTLWQNYYKMEMFQVGVAFKI